MAKLESYSNLTKLQEDLWKKNFCSNFDLGLSVYSKTSDLSFKSSFSQKSSAKGSSTFGSTYFQYKAAEWLLKEQFTSASLFKGTFEYTHPKLSQAKFKLEVETSKPGEYKHTVSGECSHDNYKAKGSLVNLNDVKLNVVAGTNGNGAGADLAFKVDQRKLTTLGLALWTFKPTWRGVLKYTSADRESLADGDFVGSLYLKRNENLELGAAVGLKNQNLTAQGTVQYNFEQGKLLKARIDQEGKLGLALRTKVGSVTLINGTEFPLLDHSGRFNYGFRIYFPYLNMRPARILINTRTWARDTYELFDYECSSVKIQVYRASETCVISRKSASVEFHQTLEETPEHAKVLAQVFLKNSIFLVAPGQEPNLWLVVNQLKDGHELKDLDILKIGRVKLRAKMMTSVENYGNVDREQHEAGDLCKICFCDEDSDENPLIAPCSCTGSMKFIHLKCIKSWLDFRSTKSVRQNSTYIYCKSMDCEICMKPFVFDFFQLKQFALPGLPALILECVDKDKGNSRAVHFIQCREQETFKLGRGHESDIKFFDISVSRIHATLEYFNGKYIIKDHKSKFGTLVQVTSEFEIDQQCILQSGRTLLTITQNDEVSEVL